MKSTAVESTSWENSFASEDFFLSPTSVFRTVLKYSDLRKTQSKGKPILNFSVYPPHTEDEGVCFDDFPVGAGDAEVPLVPVLVELPQLGHHMGLVNAHPEEKKAQLAMFDQLLPDQISIPDTSDDNWIVFAETYSSTNTEVNFQIFHGAQ